MQDEQSIMEEDQFIEDLDIVRPNNTTLIPNHLVIMPGMTAEAFRLYGWYKAVVMEIREGRWPDPNNLYENIPLTESEISDGLKTLEELEIIKITETESNGEEEPSRHITILV